MEIITLSVDQIEWVYENYFRSAFKRSELKPLNVILKAEAVGNYDCLGLVDQDRIIGYAFLIRTQKDYLLDYLGVAENLRNQGLGSVILQKLAVFYEDADSLICEVENPSYADGEERQLQERRCTFYKRNGFYDTGVEVRTFSVEYRILELKGSCLHTKEEIRQIYERHYRAALPYVVYKTMIRIHDEFGGNTL